MSRKSKKQPWFVVDQQGLAKKLARKGKEFVISELLQNAWDAPGTTECHLTCVYKRGRVVVTVEDNSPAGFTDLTHAYTLFAPSVKESDNVRYKEGNHTGLPQRKSHNVVE